MSLKTVLYSIELRQSLSSSGAQKYPLEDNLAWTAEYVQTYGDRVLVEGIIEQLSVSGGRSQAVQRDSYVEKAVDYMARTGVDLLVADLGTEQQSDRVGEVRYLKERAQALTASLGEARLVLHGTSSLNPDQMTGLAEDGVIRVNMWTRIVREAGQHAEAERLLRRALALAPGFDDARLDLVRVLKQLDRIDEAVDCAAQLIGRNPRHALAHYLHASMLAIAARHEEAITAYRESIRLRPDNPTAQVGLGHLLKTLGRQEEGIAAYREAMRLQPDFAEVYWSLANLKTFRFSAAEVADMERRLAQESLDDDARVHFMFTLGKAHEDVREFDRAFEYYDKACRTQRMRIAYDPVDTEVMHQRIRKVFNPQLLAGAPAVPAAADAQTKPAAPARPAALQFALAIVEVSDGTVQFDDFAAPDGPFHATLKSMTVRAKGLSNAEGAQAAMIESSSSDPSSLSPTSLPPVPRSTRFPGHLVDSRCGACPQGSAATGAHGQA